MKTLVFIHTPHYHCPIIHWFGWFSGRCDSEDKINLLYSVGVPIVGAGEMWGRIASTLVPGPLSVIYQSPMRLITVPVLDLVLICSAQWEFSVHLIEYALRGPLVIGLTLKSAVIW
jgi:hypothetical protein